MACEHPLLAVNLGRYNGSYKIKILPKRYDQNIHSLEDKYGYDNLLMLPCGCCAGCKISHQREWSVRCSLEAEYHAQNCMITLTYEDRLRPKRLIKRDLQDFIKRMRNKGIHFRYFGCGEYGTLNGNCHFHIIMFGYWPKDAKFEFNSKSGYPVYSSKFVFDVWHRGFISVSEMSPGTAAYVAGYVDKKLGDGEFVLMSKRPGIGERYFREHLFDIYAYDNIVGAFGVAKVPRYGDKIADQMFYDLEDLKAKRKAASNYNLISLMEEHSLSWKEDAIALIGQKARDRLAKRRRM